MTGVLAHIGHWYAELLYVAPVAVVAGWLGISTHREKRRAAAQDDGRRATPDRIA